MLLYKNNSSLIYLILIIFVSCFKDLEGFLKQLTIYTNLKSDEMKLKEEAFMFNLINASYRRKMVIFVINIVVVVISAIILINNFGYFEPKMHGLNIMIPIVIFGFSLGRILVYAFEKGLPWSMKKDQIKALKEQSDAKADFEDLRFNVPLHEYFL